MVFGFILILVQKLKSFKYFIFFLFHFKIGPKKSEFLKFYYIIVPKIGIFESVFFGSMLRFVTESSKVFILTLVQKLKYLNRDGLWIYFLY